MLKGKNILLGVTGSIAAYKIATLIRLLVKEGADVRVVMTPLAKEFITPLTLATLSKHPILVDFFNPENGEWNSHVDIGLWADLYLVAPASANTIAKMAHGVADNLLLTTYLSVKCPVMVAPAMDLDMYRHPTTQRNIEQLKGYGNIIVEATSGELASGLSGKGRMEEPEKLLDIIIQFFAKRQSLFEKKILVTSGPTHEPIDPVRFIGNHSSGKMGKSIALELAYRGATVVFITGPVSILPQHPNIQTIQVETAKQMHDAALEVFDGCSAAILAAAVADFSPKVVQKQKVKRKDDALVLELVPTCDIAKELGKLKQKGQVVIGFALETENEEANASAKLKSKNLDLIVLNSLNEKGAGFGTDTNRVTLIHRDGTVKPKELKTKEEVASDIVDELVGLLK
ncbi:MAG TPA: bifunctional phosphopantothenoylcysteine decarboxylase/phosphopantothenate--cysteine ligase CoaBC [Tenuifilaceae bacterium]|nr:bifunctional phosphopantothenoylcysteine decarboxylase/phosphopantothenate--cysteine ligase CoaBC [Tenuifilaceae bacterium]